MTRPRAPLLPAWWRRLTGGAPEAPDEIGQARQLIRAIDAGGIPLNPMRVNAIARALGLEVSGKARVEDTIARIRRSFDPEHLVIEPSGVASPSGVLEALESAGVKQVSVVGIVDATEFLVDKLKNHGLYERTARIRCELHGLRGLESDADERVAVGLCGELGLPRRVAIVSYEAEMDIVIHSENGGNLVAEINPELIAILAYDSGPGIEDVQCAMQPGWSTAPDWIREMGFGAGMGLVNIKATADEMYLDSWPRRSTRLEAVIYLKPGEGKTSNETDGNR